MIGVARLGDRALPRARPREAAERLFVTFGIDLPQGQTVFATRTVIVSLLVGTIVTLLASIRPARRATRVPPIAAVREGSVLPVSRFAKYGPVTALVVLALAIALVVARGARQRDCDRAAPAGCSASACSCSSSASR